MIQQEIQRLYNILVSFLGESKGELDETFQLQFPCPRCIENKGEREASKFNLEVNLKKGVFQCWSCAQHDDEMHGSIMKLIRLYGSDEILHEYKSALSSLMESKFYEIQFSKNDFNIEHANSDDEVIELPPNYVRLKEKKVFSYNEKKCLDYLFSRGIGWDIINKHEIGYTEYDDHLRQLSSRIIIPSRNMYGELNYWTGRDFTKLEHRQKYYNPTVERKDLIFDEDKVNWDADVTLVEGPFDHIVVPNSIPLLGKALNQDFKIYQDIMKKCNAHVNIWLDGDAFEDIKKIYRTLNTNGMKDKIRCIPTNEDLDPSMIYQLYGKKGIIEHLKGASIIKEIYL